MTFGSDRLSRLLPHPTEQAVTTALGHRGRIDGPRTYWLGSLKGTSTKHLPLLVNSYSHERYLTRKLYNCQDDLWVSIAKLSVR